MSAFADLVESRRRWIEDVLIPWCRQASAADLARAEQVWHDLAGRIAPEFTLWMWAWSRFPGLVIPDLLRLDEAVEVLVTLKDGRTLTGSPDARLSRQDQLTLVARSGPGATILLDEIASLQPRRSIEPVPDRPITSGP